MILILSVPFVFASSDVNVKVSDFSGNGLGGIDVSYKNISSAKWSTTSPTNQNGETAFTISTVSYPKYLFRAKCGTFTTTKKDGSQFTSDVYVYSSVAATDGQPSSTQLICGGQEITFNTIYDDGTPASGVYIRSRYVWDATGEALDVFTGYTDSNGVMKHWLPYGGNNVYRVNPDGTANSEGIAIPSENPNIVYMFISAKGQTTLTIKDIDGNVIANKPISVYLKGVGFANGISNKTNAEGVAGFTLTPGVYIVLIQDLSQYNGICDSVLEVAANTRTQKEIICKIHPVSFKYNFVDPVTGAVIGPAVGIQHLNYWIDPENGVTYGIATVPGSYLYTDSAGENLAYLTEGNYKNYDWAPYVVLPAHNRAFTVSGPTQVVVNINYTDTSVVLHSRYSDGWVLPSVTMTITSQDNKQIISRGTNSSGDALVYVSPAEFKATIYCVWPSIQTTNANYFTVSAGQTNEKTMYCGKGEMKIIAKDVLGNPLQDVKVYSTNPTYCTGCGIGSDGSPEDYTLVVGYSSKAITNTEGYAIYKNVDERATYNITGETLKGEKRSVIVSVGQCMPPQCVVEVTGFASDKSNLVTTVLKKNGAPMVGTYVRYYTTTGTLLTTLNANVSGVSVKNISAGTYVLGAGCFDAQKKYNWFKTIDVVAGETREDTITCFKDGLALTTFILNNSDNTPLEGAYIDIYRKFGTNTFIKTTEAPLYIPDTTVYLGDGEYRVDATYQGQKKSYTITHTGASTLTIRYDDPPGTANDGFLGGVYYILPEVKASDFKPSLVFLAIAAISMSLLIASFQARKTWLKGK